jgi:hypothetical protein
MKNIKYFLLGLSLVFISSCTKEDLFLLPDGSESDATFYQTEGQLTEALNACYQPFGNTVWNGSTFLWGSITSDDAVAGGADFSDQQDFQWADRFIMLPYDAKNDNVRQYYAKWYVMNTRCNYVLKYANQETAFGKSVVAQAYFLKGFAYFMETRMFGRAAIIDNVPDVNDKTPLSSQADVYAAIESYLKKSLDLKSLPKRIGTKDPSADCQATEATVQAFLGKVLVNEASLLNKPEKYSEAIPYLLAVANSGNYILESDYGKIFAPDNYHGVESIFEINFSMNGPNTWDATSLSNTTYTLCSPRNGEVPIPGGTLDFGWGMNQPTKKLVAAFDAMGDKVRKLNSMISSDSLTGYYTAVGKTIAWDNELTGWWDLKHIRRKGFFNMANQVAQNTIVMRLSEVYLLLAEAYNKTGDDANARKYLNLVRERAQLAPNNDSGAALLTAIKKERQLELCLEGERYFDLVRWGDAETELTGEDYSNEANMGNNYTTGLPGVKSKGLFPIPLQEISTDPTIVQNEGY